MKKLLFFFLTTLSGLADILPPSPATLSEVEAGTIRTKYVSPYTLSRYSWLQATGGVTAAQTTNIAAYQAFLATNGFVGGSGTFDYLALSNRPTGMADNTNHAIALVQSATNSMSTNMPDRSGVWLDVRTFGAVDDPSGDDTAAIQAALDACTNSYTSTTSDRATVYIPAGYWVISDTLRIRASGTRILGDGRDRTRIIMWPTTTKNGIGLSAWTPGNPHSTNLYYLRLEGFTLYRATRTPESASTAAGICFTNSMGSQAASRFTLRDLSVYNWHKGFYAEHVVGGTFENVEAYFNNTGFWLDKCDAVTFNNCFAGRAIDSTYLTNLFVSAASYGWYIYDAGFACTVIGGESSYCNSPFYVSQGNLIVLGHNSESFFSSGVNVQAGISSAAFVSNSRFTRYPTNASPVFRFSSGAAYQSTIGWNNYASGLGDLVEVNGAGDVPGYLATSALRVTNAATATTFYLPYYTGDGSALTNVAATVEGASSLFITNSIKDGAGIVRGQLTAGNSTTFYDQSEQLAIELSDPYRSLVSPGGNTIAQWSDSGLEIFPSTSAGSLTSTGTVAALKFAGDGSSLTNLPPTVWVFCTNNLATHTGTTDETTVMSVTLPAGVLGKNGFLELDALFYSTNSGRKDWLFKLGGQSVMATWRHEQASSRPVKRIMWCADSHHTKYSPPFSLASFAEPWTSAGSSFATIAVGTDTNVTFAVSCQLTNTADAGILKSLTLRAYYSP